MDAQGSLSLSFLLSANFQSLTRGEHIDKTLAYGYDIEVSKVSLAEQRSDDARIGDTIVDDILRVRCFRRSDVHLLLPVSH